VLSVADTKTAAWDHTAAAT